MAKHRVNWHIDMGKKHLHEGDIIDLSKFSEDHAAQFLACGVVTPLEADVPAGNELVAADELAKMSKDQLVEYAKKQYNADIDPADMTKGQMLAEIATLAE